MNVPIKEKPTTAELIERGFDPQNGRIDILFIYPSDSTAERYGRKDMGNVEGNLIPLGIASIAGYLREKGWGVGVLDCPALRINAEDVYEIIEERDPEILAFSTTTYSLSKALELAKYIRINFPNKLTLLGGSHANVAGKSTADRYEAFDIIANSSDGELVAHELTKSYSSTNYDRNTFLNDYNLLQNINGIIFRKGKDIVQTLPAKQIDLNELPFPARDLFPMERYIPLPNQYQRLPLTNMVVIRGCPYVCSFCDQANTVARRPDASKVVKEIKHCVENFGIKEISFWDDTMTYHKKWMEEFLNLLINEKLDVIWSCYAAVNTVNEEILKLMKEAGCWNIFYGFETGVPELAKNILSNHKNKDFNRMKQVAAWTKAAGIQIRGSFMIGIPGETPELAKQTIKNAIKLDPDYAQFSIVCPFPGTQLEREIDEGKWGKWITRDYEDYNVFQVTWLPHGYKSVKELEEMQRYAYRKFYLRPKYIFFRLIKIRRFEDIRRYIKGGIALIKGFL